MSSIEEEKEKAVWRIDFNFWVNEHNFIVKKEKAFPV